MALKLKPSPEDVVVLKTYHVHSRELFSQRFPDVISCHCHVCNK